MYARPVVNNAADPADDLRLGDVVCETVSIE
jgi:hypothetical protein